MNADPFSDGSEATRRPLDPEQASIGEILSRFTSDFGELVHKEVELARVETRDEIKHFTSGAGLGAAAAATAYGAVLFMSAALALGLAEVMPEGWAFLIVAIAHLIAAGILTSAARRRIARIDPTPHMTIETMKENVEWAKAQTR